MIDSLKVFLMFSENELQSFQVPVSLNIWYIPRIFENVKQIGRTRKTYVMTDFL